jgi:hypothetical protein
MTTPSHSGGHAAPTRLPLPSSSGAPAALYGPGAPTRSRQRGQPSKTDGRLLPVMGSGARTGRLGCLSTSSNLRFQMS